MLIPAYQTEISRVSGRYALYKSDPDLKLAHAAFPWIVTWDDHEVDNNYANDIPEDNQPRAAFLERRTHAYQAYYEHMPLRRSSLPHGSELRLYRRLRFGDLIEFSVLDTRQYCADQPWVDGNTLLCPEALDSKATWLILKSNASVSVRELLTRYDNDLIQTKLKSSTHSK